MRTQAELAAAAEVVGWFFRSGAWDRHPRDTRNHVIGVDAAIAWALGEDGPVNPVAVMLEAFESMRRDANRQD